MLTPKEFRDDIRFVAGIAKTLEVSDERLLAEFNMVVRLPENDLYKRCMMHLFNTDELGLSRHMAVQLGVRLCKEKYK